MKHKPLFILGAVMVLVITGSAFAYQKMQGTPSSPGRYAELAQCITDSGAKFYGAFWCPHCQDQKRAFGDAVGLLPYVECSAPDGKSQLEVCTTAGVTSYPTWEFGDGTRTTGNIKLESLAQLTKCPFPAPVSDTSTENPTQ